jgi:hypothetical protein
MIGGPQGLQESVLIEEKKQTNEDKEGDSNNE